MFAAALLFCLYSPIKPPECGKLTDTRGPYATEAKCKTRTVEMRDALYAMLKAQGFVGQSSVRPVCEKTVKGTAI